MDPVQEAVSGTRSSQDRLDASAGRSRRAASGAPGPGGASHGRPSARDGGPSRAKPVAAGLLVAGLAAGWLLVQHDSTNGSERAAISHPTTRPSTARAGGATRADTVALRALLADAGACADVVGPVPAVRCDVGGVRLDARLLTAAEARRTYVSSSGARIAPGRGPSACAQGLPDERAWSRPETPLVAAGRYRCRIEDGAAAIWWTDEHGVLAHAVATDADLGRLFAWWRAHRNG